MESSRSFDCFSLWFLFLYALSNYLYCNNPYPLALLEKFPLVKKLLAVFACYYQNLFRLGIRQVSLLSQLYNRFQPYLT